MEEVEAIPRMGNMEEFPEALSTPRIEVQGLLPLTPAHQALLIIIKDLQKVGTIEVEAGVVEVRVMSLSFHGCLSLI